jgi:hypothetical protein
MVEESGMSLGYRLPAGRQVIFDLL